MAEPTTKWQQMLTDLEREREELRVRVHLAKADARDEWDKAERKLAELREKLRQRAGSAKGEAKDSMQDIGEAGKQLVQEIKQGFERVRKTL